ncbi:TIGR02452 family protein [Dictyobacter alpinus]|uniref:TIGR02452 family protein n=1 Tax=Dictyobacter alpinus TaxID=2014873 RepID=A0A402B8L0_9CHLR|nr:TIGR02452 family protein [Dictyobacter alpinus]GCE27657.1 TIGR02452 family protein [Dictyobacter alpinus]
MDTKAIAQGTVAALKQGQYTTPEGNTIDLTSLLAACLSGTQSYDPHDLERLRERVLAQPVNQQTTSLAIVNETTLQGCARLIASQQYRRIGVLNFASAKNPGGGFLRGARAQEESLARSSALYFSLRQCPEHYAFHRAQDTCLYSDRMIYSPACPVFRDDAGQWLAQPYVIDIITSPAPNAGVVLQNEPDHRLHIVPTLTERASKILALAAAHQCDTLILGAWGCGVFQNDPRTVARIFHDYLGPCGLYSHCFRHVLFSVYDRAHPPKTFEVFARQFANLA